MAQIIVVSDQQISAAQALVRISGGLDKVEPIIAKIATARPATRAQRAQLARMRGTREATDTERSAGI
jgi:hypothetical protein